MRYLSAPEKDRRDIDGRLGRYDLCRIGCHSDIGSVGGRACGKKRGSSARRWEASPSHALVSSSQSRSGQANNLNRCAQRSSKSFQPANHIMNIVVRFSRIHHAVLQFPTIVCVRNFFFSFQSLGIALRSHRYASGASAPTSARAGKGAARTRPRAHKARAEREEAYYGHQEECQGGTTCALLSHLPPHFLFQVGFAKEMCDFSARRTLARSWQRT